VPEPLDADGYNTLVLCGTTAGTSLELANATLLLVSVSSAFTLALLN